MHRNKINNTNNNNPFSRHQQSLNIHLNLVNNNNSRRSNIQANRDIHQPVECPLE